MKRITFYFTMLLLLTFSWQGMAQFTEDFEAAVPPTNWVKETPDTSNDITQSNAQDHTTGSGNSARFASYSSSGDYNQYLITDAITVVAGTNDQISFWHRKHNTNSTESLEWGVSTSQASTDVASWTAVTLSNTDWQLTTVDLSSYVGQTIYFAWHYFGDYAYYVYLDDVVNNAIPACADATNLAASNFVAPSNAVLSWDDAGVTGYNYEIQPQGTAQGDASVVASGSSTNNSFTATSLVDGTDYTLYVQTDCGGGVFGNYVSYDFSFVLPPVNDTMAGAIAIVPNVEGSVCDATTEFTAHMAADGTTDSGMDGTCNSTDTGLDVFYTWTATSDALTWNDGSGNPGIVVRDASGVEITCSGTYAGTDYELSGWAIGDDLILQVYDFGTSDVDVTFCLSEKTLPLPPANDTCATAIVVACGDDLIDQTTVGASDNGDDVGCTQGKGVWFKLVGDDSEVTLVSTTDFDHQIGVASSSDCVAFTNVACKDGSTGTETVTFNADLGTEYFIYIGHYNDTSTVTGNFGLAVSCVPYPSCTEPTDLVASDVADVSALLGWTAGVDGETMWDVEWGDVGFVVETGAELGMVADTTDNPYAVSGLTASTDYEFYVRASCSATLKSDWVGPFAFTTLAVSPANNFMSGAIPIVPSAEGSACDVSAATFTAHLAADGTTDSGMDGDCNGTLTGLDRFYSWTATSLGLVWNDGAGNPGIIIRDASGVEITCEGTFGADDTILAGWAVGDDLIIQIYDFDTADVDVTFCLAEVNTFNPEISPMEVADCANAQFTVDVDVTSLGGASAVTVSDDQGSAAVAGLGLGVVNFGPYPDGTAVNFTVTSDDDVTYTSSQAFTYSCPPVNDLAADAIAVACGDAVTGDTSAGATIDLQGDCGSVENNAPNMWYTFTGNGVDAENVKASLCGSSYDTQIAIYTGTPGSLVCYANNDDSCSLQSEVTFVSDGIQTYYIEVQGYSAFSTGAFTLNMSCEPACTPAVANQYCAVALAIVIDDAAITSDNTCATINVENPSCDLFGTIADVWFSFVAPAAGITSISTTLGSATEINLAVYEGACGSLVEVAGSCMDTADAPDTVSLNTLVPGDTYYVQAWNAGSTGATPQEGTFDIQITNTVISVPDCPTLVSPVDGATDVFSPVTLDWDEATTGDPADSYNLYISVNGGAEFLFDNYTDTQAPPLGIQPGITVVWRVVPVNAAGENTACTTTFTMSSVSETGDYDGDGIDNITEYDAGTDYTLPCDPVQAAGYTGYDATNTIWMDADCDGDGQTNDFEASNGSDPYDATSTASLEELATVGFEYYPNPVNNNLTVKANESITSIAIFNMLGQQVKQVNPSSLNAQIDMTNLANGTYFIKATVGEKVGTFKIVKK